MINLEAMAYTYWEPCEVEYIRTWWGKKDTNDIAFALKRTASACRMKASKLGITDKRHWYNIERTERCLARREYVRQHFGRLSCAEMAVRWGVVPSTVRNDVVELGLSRPHHTPANMKQVVLSEYGRGKSASQLARELGCTKNAVIGTAQRLGLSRPRAGA